MYRCAQRPTLRAAILAWLALGLVATAQAKPSYRHRPAIVFVGTFDPIHEGHVSIARAARDTMGGRVLIVPLENGSAGKHPVPIANRLAMARRAVRGMRDIEVADRATVDRYMHNREHLLDAIAKHHPLYMLYGADAYQASIDRGYVGLDLEAGRQVVIAPREGTTLPQSLPPGVSVIPGT